VNPLAMQPEVALKTLHLTTPFRIAHGASSTRQVVRLIGGGAVGEAPFVPYYHENVQATLEWLSLEQGAGQGTAPSRAAELALDLWKLDLEGKRTGLPLSARVPADLPKRTGLLPGCRSFSIPTDLEAFAKLVHETARQFQVLKLKLGSGSVDFDQQIVATARRAAPRAKLLVDVNGGWSVEEAVKIIPRLDDYALELIEQPIHHEGGIPAWAALRLLLPETTTPLYADESAQTIANASDLLGLVQGVNVKLLKCGSFAEAVRMIQGARNHGLGVLLGCMIESSIGITAAAHLAAWADYADLDGHLYLADDDYLGLTFDAQGCLIMPEGPGIGVLAR
jgi:L-Ala-D/L-Glu epimerase